MLQKKSTKKHQTQVQRQTKTFPADLEIQFQEAKKTITVIGTKYEAAAKSNSMSNYFNKLWQKKFGLVWKTKKKVFCLNFV